MAKAACFVTATFVGMAPLVLTAQAPASGASNADSTISRNPDAPETNESAELAQKLTNPLAALISIPIQSWFDFNLGPKKDGFRYTMEAQPVFPVRISKNWNLLSHTTIPVVYQQNVYGRTTQTGLSGSTEAFFFPRCIPNLSFGEPGRSSWWRQAPMDCSARTSSLWTYAMTSYDTYNWTAGRWTAIVNPIRVSKLMKLGPQRLSVGGALRCTLASPQYQPKGCGLEFTVTPVYPASR